MKLSLGLKQSLVLSFLIALNSGIIIAISYFNEKNLLMSESVSRFKSITNNLAFNAEYGTLIKNTSTLDQLVRGIAQEQDVIYVELTDKNNNIVAKSGKPQKDTYLIMQPILTNKVSSGDEASFLLDTSSQNMEPKSPSAGSVSGHGGGTEEIGKVHVEFDLTPMQAKMAGMRQKAMALTLILVILGIVLTYVLIHIMISPLKDLVHAAKRVTTGELDFQIETKSKDEIGELTEVFNQMIKNLSVLAKVASKIAEGDLTVKVSVLSDKDVFGNTFSNMVSNLKNIVTQINKTGNAVANSGQGLSRVSEQATQTTAQLSGVVNQVTQSTSSIAKNAQAATISSQNANKASHKGRELAEKFLAKMLGIQSGVAKSKDAIESLGQRSAKIGEIVSIITKIAEQTNLLSLNAAIEAARAGESGRGFAIVADEIRKLAEHSASSAQEISKLIAEVQQDTQSAVKVTEQATKEVEEGGKMMSETLQGLQVILTSVEDVTRQIEQIASSTEELAASTEEAAASSEEQSAAIQEVAASAQTLSHTATELKNLVAKFKT